MIDTYVFNTEFKYYYVTVYMWDRRNTQMQYMYVEVIANEGREAERAALQILQDNGYKWWEDKMFDTYGGATAYDSLEDATRIGRSGFVNDSGQHVMLSLDAHLAMPRVLYLRIAPTK